MGLPPDITDSSRESMMMNPPASVVPFLSLGYCTSILRALLDSLGMSEYAITNTLSNQLNQFKHKNTNIDGDTPGLGNRQLSHAHQALHLRAREP